jgi:hypothetical protein
MEVDEVSAVITPEARNGETETNDKSSRNLLTPIFASRNRAFRVK